MANEFIIKNGFVSKGDSIILGNLSGQTFNIINTPVNNNSATEILVRNSTTGNVEYRNSSTLSGGSSTTNVFVNSGDADVATQQLTFTNTTGGTFNVTNSTALFSDNDINVTGGTYDANTGCVTFGTNSGTTFDICGFVTGLTDTFTTGGTYNNTTGEITFTKTDNSTYDVDLSSISGGTTFWDTENGGLKSINQNAGSINGASDGAVLVGGYFNTNNIYDGKSSTIINGVGNTISGASTSTIISTSNSDIIGRSGSKIDQGVIIGGASNNIQDTTIDSDRSLIAGGINNDINNSTNSSMLGATLSTIIGGNSNIIIGGSINKLLNTSNSVILGGQNITGTTNNTVYVPNLNIGTVGGGTPLINLGLDSSGNVVTGTTSGGGTMSFTVEGDNGTPFTISSGDTLEFVGFPGINVGVADPEVRIALDYSGADSFILEATNGTGITVDGANDKLVIYDNDAGTVKYINANQLPSSGAASAPITGYSYNSDNNTFTIGLSGGTSFDSQILEVSGLTVTNDLIVSGSTGIGTDTPTEKLHIKSTTDAKIKIEADINDVDDTDTADILLSQDGGISTSNIGISPDSINDLVIGVNSITNPSIKFATRSDGTTFSTTADTKMTLSNNGNLGIGTINPTKKLHVDSGDILIQNDAIFDSNLNTNIPYVRISGDTNDLAQLIATTEGSLGVGIGSRGSAETGFPGYGKLKDGFLYSSNAQNGLNIISSPGTDTEDYIRFYAGDDADGTTANMFIAGTGDTKGYVGINTETPNAQLFIQGDSSSSTGPTDQDNFSLQIQNSLNQNILLVKNGNNGVAGSTNGRVCINGNFGSSAIVGDDSVFSVYGDTSSSSSALGLVMSISDGQTNTLHSFYNNGATSLANGTIQYSKVGVGTTSAASIDAKLHVKVGDEWKSVHGNDYTLRIDGLQNVAPYTAATNDILTLDNFGNLNVKKRTTTENFTMTSGATDGYVLTSDSNGVGSWQPSSGSTSGYWEVGGEGNSLYDNKGSHILTGSSRFSMIAGGETNKITSHDSSGIFVGKNNVLTGSSIFTETQNVIIGGTDNTISSLLGFITNSTIIGGDTNFIAGRVNNAAIIGGRDHIINNSITDSVIIGGVNSRIGGSRNVVLGGSNMTGITGSDTVFVPKLNIRDVSNGTPTMNLGVDSNGLVVSAATGSNSGNCITDLWVTNLESCSPLNINTQNQGNVYIGSQGGLPLITMDITTPNEPGMYFGEESFIRYKENEKKLIIGEEEGGGKVILEAEGLETVEVSKTATKINQGDLEAESGNIIIKSGNSKTLVIEDIPDVSGANLGTDVDGKLIDLPSDSRVKVNIQEIDEVVDPLEFMKLVKGYQFEYDPRARISKPGTKHYGFKVDDFREGLKTSLGNQTNPDEQIINDIGKTLVKRCKTKYNIGNDELESVDAMNYVDLIPFMVESIKKLDTNIDNITTDGGSNSNDKYLNSATLPLDSNHPNVNQLTLEMKDGTQHSVDMSGFRNDSNTAHRKLGVNDATNQTPIIVTGSRQTITVRHDLGEFYPLFIIYEVTRGEVVLPFGVGVPNSTGSIPANNVTGPHTLNTIDITFESAGTYIVKFVG